MKKSFRLLAMTLVCVLAVMLPLSCASADMCYELIKYAFSAKESPEFIYLGEPMLLEDPGDMEENTVFMLLSLPEGIVILSGKNANHESETIIWAEVDALDVLVAALQVSNGYDELTAYLDECTQMTYMVIMNEDNASVMVDNAEDAQAFADAIQQAVNGN